MRAVSNSAASLLFVLHSIMPLQLAVPKSKWRCSLAADRTSLGQQIECVTTTSFWVLSMKERSRAHSRHAQSRPVSTARSSVSQNARVSRESPSINCSHYCTITLCNSQQVTREDMSCGVIAASVSRRLGGIVPHLSSTTELPIQICLIDSAPRGSSPPASSNAGRARSGSTSSGAGSHSAASALRPGAAFSTTKQFSPEDVAAFAALTGDSNPIHTCAAAAARRGLPAPVLPGLLMASLFPAIIGSNFPGALYLSQTLKFKRHALVRGAGVAPTASLLYVHL